MALLRSRPVLLLGPSLAAAVLACSPTPRAPTPPAAPAPAAAADTRPPAGDAASADRAFEAFAQHFLDDYLRRSPISATHAGDHRYDAMWPDISVQGDASERTWVEETRAALAKLPRAGLSEQNQIDAEILDDRLRFELFSLDELKSRDSDPVSYTNLVGAGIDPLVTRNFGTKE